MGLTSEFVKELSFNLAYFRENFLIIKMKQINEEIEKAEDEETKLSLSMYKEELWDITYRMGQLIDRISLDEHVDAAVSSQIRRLLAIMRSSED